MGADLNVTAVLGLELHIVATAASAGFASEAPALQRISALAKRL